MASIHVACGNSIYRMEGIRVTKLTDDRLQELMPPVHAWNAASRARHVPFAF